MSTEADERLSTLLCELVADIENSVVQPDPRGVMSPPVPDGANLYVLPMPRHERGRRGTTRKVVGAAAAAAVLAGVPLAGVSLLPSSSRLGQGSASAAALLSSLAKTAAASKPLVRPPNGFFFTAERGGALVEGKAFAAMVDDTWETWYRPASSTATGLEVGAMSIPAFVSGYGKQAWVRAKEPAPNWVRTPGPVTQIGTANWAVYSSGYPAATPYPMTGAGTLMNDASTLGSGTMLGYLGGFPGPPSLGALFAGLQAPLPQLRAKDLLALEHLPGIVRARGVRLPGGPVAHNVAAVAFSARGLMLEMAFDPATAALVGYEELVTDPREAASNFKLISTSPAMTGLVPGEVISWVRPQGTAVVASLPAKYAGAGG
jgi:hypothetical protein